jgi:hypothetical protein
MSRLALVLLGGPMASMTSVFDIPRLSLFMFFDEPAHPKNKTSPINKTMMRLTIVSSKFRLG